jgi:hypothetical protein
MSMQHGTSKNNPVFLKKLNEYVLSKNASIIILKIIFFYGSAGPVAKWQNVPGPRYQLAVLLVLPPCIQGE